MFGKPRLRALQVEVTSRCTRKCRICPRSALAAGWREGDLDERQWQAIEPYLKRVEHVHLQGWGEPLLHPRLADWARAARRAGCTVGLTTNGDLLEDATDWLLEGDVGLMAFSVAGAASANATNRDGADLKKLLARVARFGSRAREKRLGIKLQLSYLLTRENAAGLAGVVEQAAQAGLDEVFVIHLDYRPSAWHVEQAAFSSGGLAEGVLAGIETARDTARKLEIAFRGPATAPREMVTCDLDPQRFAFVGFDGRVGPCVNLLLPVKGDIARLDENGRTTVEPVSYGRLPDSGLQKILASKQRKRFIRPFEKRLEAERRFLSAAYLQPGYGVLDELDGEERARDAALAENPFPPACTGCAKADGW